MLLATCSASAALVATPPLGTPMPYCLLVSLSRPSPTSAVYRGPSAYRLEQRSRPVFVDGQTSPLLDRRALHWCLLRRVSTSFSIIEHLRQRLFGHGGSAVGSTYSSAESIGQRPRAGKVVHDV